MKTSTFFVQLYVFAFFTLVASADDGAEKKAKEFLKINEPLSQRNYHSLAISQWNYDSNLTDYNEKLMTEEALVAAKYEKYLQAEISQFDWKNFKDESLKRQMKFQSGLGMSALSDDKFNKLQELGAKMPGIYGKGEVPNIKGTKNMTLDPDLTKIFRTSRNYSELLHYWKGWRDVSGKPIRQDYIKYVNLVNEGARLNGYKDYAEYLISSYESESFFDDIEKLWQEVKPLYEQLHAYTKRKLIEKYGDKHINKNGTIPAHLLGNMWAQTWANIFDLVAPYKNESIIDVTESLQKKNYTPEKMFKESEKFFKKLGLKEMTQEFWNNSIINKPTDRKIVCHGSAWEFGNKEDFRIKMCTVVTMEDFVTIHHEMGHVQYFMQYSDQPQVFKNGANPGFHEAIGDTLALSVLTPEHLNAVGLLDKLPKNNKRTDLNFLMNMALEKIAFLPFGYLIDRYRWEIFNNKTQTKDMNRRWWELREKYQGISPPVERSENDFDPGCKYHVPAGVPYVRYFVSFIIQFQFHEALCKLSGYNGDLHHCDISNQKKTLEAGGKLASMLQMGNSKPWPEAMELLTGQKKMSASSLLKYFKPLHDWLKEQNKGYDVSWEVPSSADAMKPDSPSTLNPTKDPKPNNTPKPTDGDNAASCLSSSFAFIVPLVVLIIKNLNI